MRLILALLLTSAFGCASLNHIEHKQVNENSFIIKQRLADDILCIKESEDETVCYHVTGKSK